jgi:hypothetical protein
MILVLSREGGGEGEELLEKSKMNGDSSGQRESAGMRCTAAMHVWVSLVCACNGKGGTDGGGVSCGSMHATTAF